MHLIKSLQNKQIQPKIFTYICLATLFLLILLELFMLLYVFPQQGGFMSLHIPSRSGGFDFMIDRGEFVVIGGIASALGVLSTFAVAGLVHSGKSKAAAAVSFVLLFAAVIFVALYVGSAFSIVWGNGAAVFGVVSVIAIGMMLEFPLLVWLRQNFKPQQIS